MEFGDGPFTDQNIVAGKLYSGANLYQPADVDVIENTEEEKGFAHVSGWEESKNRRMLLRSLPNRNTGGLRYGEKSLLERFPHLLDILHRHRVDVHLG